MPSNLVIHKKNCLGSIPDIRPKYKDIKRDSGMGLRLKQKPPEWAVSNSYKELSALDVNSVRSLFGVFDFERNHVAFVQFSELHSDQGFAVEEQIFFLSFYFDETKSLVSQLFDCTCHDCIVVS